MYAIEIDHVNPEEPVSGYNTGLATLRARLVRHARLLVRDRDVAEDLVQDTLLAVLRGHASMRGEASLTTWAVAILKHKAIDWHRSSTHREAFQFDGDAEDDGFEPADGTARAFGAASEAFLQPDRALEERQLHWAVERCMARLSDLARQVFAMRAQLGFETEEVCQRLDISQDHCRMLLHRARATLRAFLGDRYLEPCAEYPAAKKSRHAARPDDDRLSDCMT